MGESGIIVTVMGLVGTLTRPPTGGLAIEYEVLSLPHSHLEGSAISGGCLVLNTHSDFSK